MVELVQINLLYLHENGRLQLFLNLNYVESSSPASVGEEPSTMAKMVINVSGTVI
jgi:hypothetical protein